ncbi:hemerythrin domain-containing protein [Mycolicibacterium septicum]|uniref:hemerythrin domain-containing protein n=1 Tax=Mycolicibacterium septicum TaxID=98668 RepID=UPI0023610E9F|nr:hemerythrin domain-containing protein [Mycolicibacterium septicum]
MTEADSTTTKLVDIRDMLVVHTALSREFRLAPVAVERVKPDDRKHAQCVDEHLRLICNLLHAHHSGEDEILWPVLRPRLSVADRQLLDNIEAQHQDIHRCLERVNDARRRWLDQPDRKSGSALANGLQTMHELVIDHLADEERDIVPLAAAYLSDREWRAANDEGPKVLSPKMLLMTVGMCCYGTSRELIAVLLQVIPRPLRPVVTRVGGLMYARRAARVHGTRRP